MIFIALVIVLTCLKPSFITPGNLVNILKQASINGILAFGMMFVIVARRDLICPLVLPWPLQVFWQLCWVRVTIR